MRNMTSVVVWRMHFFSAGYEIVAESFKNSYVLIEESLVYNEAPFSVIEKNVQHHFVLRRKVIVKSWAPANEAMNYSHVEISSSNL